METKEKLEKDICEALRVLREVVAECKTTGEWFMSEEEILETLREEYMLDEK